ncbi:MAG TPA: Gfo/Idh/MocA family oxidoreductase, partial [Candidatus Hydrogenedentes bacterium]|nr:Gfo/Idh/MocA family oxidoreductase [Candidatus Hydrogenedentota bacterium]
TPYMSRRGFLAAGGLAVTAGMTLNRPVFGANDRLSIGVIGTGDRAGSLMADIAKLRDSHNAAITAVCDVWRINRESAAARVERWFENKPFATSRFQEVLARDDIDAVVIATPDFGHTPIMIEALKAGKDVYVEKPMALDLDNANTALALAREKERVVQVGTQRRSEGRWKAAHNFIAEGNLGHVSRISASNCFNHPRWARDFSDCKQEDVDWEAYLFNRPMVDFDPKLLRRWHLYKMCTNGISGLWMVHLIDAANIVMGATYPDSAVAHGGLYVWKDGREHNDVFHALIDFPEGFLFDWSMSLTNAAGSRYNIHGRYGTMNLDALTYSGEGGEQGKAIEAGKLTPEPDQNHMANWLECIRSRQRPNADIEFGFQHSVATIMAAEALHTGQRQRYDRENRRIYAG